MAIVSTGQITITDQNDYIYTGTTAPKNPIANLTLWIDTSVTPSLQKRWTGTAWEIVNEVKVGGRNLLRNTVPFSKKKTLTSINADYAVAFSTMTCSLEAGVKYTFSIQHDAPFWNAINTVDSVQAYLLKDNSYVYYIGLGDRVFSFTPTVSGIFTLRLDVNLPATTHSFWDMKIEEGNTATGWYPAPEDVQAQFDESKSYVDAIKANLQGQIDGNITSYFYDYEPTLTNIPASSWTPDAVRDIHLGDLFYWTLKGYAYRYQKVAGVYSWSRISDTDVTKALADAAKAQDTADGKRTVFSVQPTTAQAYSIGDLWVNATVGSWTNEFLKCITAKATGTAFNVAHWALATKYTDDSAVDNLKLGGRNLLPGSSGSFSGWSFLGFYNIINNNYIVLNNNYFAPAISPSVNVTSGDTYILTCNVTSINSDKYYIYVTNGNVDIATQQLVAYKNTLIFQATSATIEVRILGKSETSEYLVVGDIMLEKGNKASNSFLTPEEDVQAQIDESKSLLDDITNDNKLTPDEKRKLKKEWDDIYNEFPIIRDQANDVLGAADSYEDSYSYLSTYITPLLADLTTTSDIVGSTLRAKFREYYLSREMVKDDIQRAIDIQSRSLDFMKSAIEQGTGEFNGGLGLINLLLMKNLLSQVTGGMSGLGGDGVGFWTGGTHAQALADVSKTFKSAMASASLDKKDGSGHRAFGNFAWNTAGEVYLKGAIEALAGKFGLLSISGETIISDHLKFTNLPIESKTLATSPKTYTIPAKTQLSQIFKSNPTAIMDSAEIVIETATTIPYVRSTKENSSAWYLYSDDENDAATLSSNCYCYVQVKLQCLNNDVVIAESSSANSLIGCVNGNYVFPDNGWGASLTNIAVGVGTVKFRTIATISNFSPNEYVQWVSPAIRLPFNMVVTADNMSTNSLINIGVTAYVKRAFFGSDGFYVFANQNRYVYFRGAGDGSDEFELKLGTKTLRLSDVGLDVPAGLGGASINGTGAISANWGKITGTGQVVKSGSNYTITHNIGDTDYSLILTPISTNVPYFSSRAANTVVVTCTGGFDFILIRTK